MFALEPLIVVRLKEHLSSALPDVRADVKGWSEDGDRKVIPGRVSVLVRLAGTPPNAVSRVAAAIGTGWWVDLRAKRSPQAATLLDSVFAEALCGLHDWAPASVGGRKWSQLALQSADLAEPIDDGVFGISLYFQSAAIYPGKR